MSTLSYEAVARFAQQGGTIYFGMLFFGGLILAWIYCRSSAR